MFFEVIFTLIFSFIWGLFMQFSQTTNNIKIIEGEEIKWEQIVYQWNYDLKQWKEYYGNSEQFFEVVSDFSFLESSKKTNFLNLNINEFQWGFDIYFSANTKIVWVVYKNNDKSIDFQFPNILNKWKEWRIWLNYNLPNWNWTSLINNPFNNDLWNHEAYFIHLENWTRQLSFESADLVENISINLFLEPLWNNNIIEWFDWENYYNWVRYILKKKKNSHTLEFKNFVLTKWKKWFWYSNIEENVVISYQSPLIFYLNEFK